MTTSTFQNVPPAQSIVRGLPAFVVKSNGRYVLRVGCEEKHTSSHDPRPLLRALGLEFQYREDVPPRSSETGGRSPGGPSQADLAELDMTS